jgi:hypothetical protein
VILIFGKRFDPVKMCTLRFRDLVGPMKIMDFKPFASKLSLSFREIFGLMKKLDSKLLGNNWTNNKSDLNHWEKIRSSKNVYIKLQGFSWPNEDNGL